MGTATRWWLPSLDPTPCFGSGSPIAGRNTSRPIAVASIPFLRGDGQLLQIPPDTAIAVFLPLLLRDPGWFARVLSDPAVLIDVHCDLSSASLKSYLAQVMSLDYDERPDYDGLRTLLRRPLELMRTSAYDPVDLKVVP